MTLPSRRPAVAGAAATVFVFLALPALATEPLTVMSYNIRYDTERDGPNRWAVRRQMVFDLLREHDPDIVGLQEALDSQIRDIVEAVPAYAVVGVGRDDGKAAGEFSAILFRRDRLRVAEAGTFWFSDTPAVPGSRTWGNTITRICTWARFTDREGRTFWVYNVHLDHESQPSRERSTELLLRRITGRPSPAAPVVITGDFNAGEDNRAMDSLLRARPGTEDLRAPAFVDTFRIAHPDTTEAGTFNGFRIGQQGGPKIDYVLVQPGTEVLEAAIIRDSRNERYPSDHFPVIARIRFQLPASSVRLPAS